MNRVSESKVKISEIHTALCDHLNEGFGYQIRIIDTRGNTVLFTSCDPANGTDLLTYKDALRVAEQYAKS